MRDPDTCIAGTAIVHQEFTSGQTIALSQGMKITGALDVISPGATGPEAVTSATPTFTWQDDSSEDNYHVTVVDSLGTEIWNTDIPGTSGTNPSVVYAGPALQQRTYYQFHAVSSKNHCELAQTEDLKGIFYLSPPE